MYGDNDGRLTPIAESFPIPSFHEFVQRRSSYVTSGETHGPSLYAHAWDRTVQTALELGPFRQAFNRLVNHVSDLSLGANRYSGVQASPRSFPDVYACLLRCTDALGMRTPRLVVSHGDLNAFAVGTGESAWIWVSSLMVNLYSPEELTYVVGHECGHIQNGHAPALMLLRWLATQPARLLGIMVPWLDLALITSLHAYVRRAEITADRAGLICCHDIAAATNAVIRLVTGFASPEQVDIADMVGRARRDRDRGDFARFGELFVDHPIVDKRIQALEVFSRSELYFGLTGLPLPAESLLDRASLESETERIVRVL